MSWGPWLKCSVTCGGGTRLRTRACNQTVGGPNTEYCIGDDFESRQCHRYDCQPLCRTCAEWVDRGLEDETHVEIKPSADLKSFQVHCNLTALNGSVVTEVEHDRMEVTEVDGYETAGEYQIKLKYSTDVSSMLALAEISAHCRQYISWQCKAATIWSITTKDLAMVFWEDRDGMQQYYWGGATPGSTMCECGEQGNCAQDGTRCNCDANDDVLREDVGWLVDENIPITAFFAGDTGAPNEKGYHTLGPYACYGSK